MKNKFKRRHKYALYHIGLMLTSLQEQIAQIRDDIPVSDGHSDADKLLSEIDNHLDSVTINLDAVTQITAAKDRPGFDASDRAMLSAAEMDELEEHGVAIAERDYANEQKPKKKKHRKT